MKNLKFLIPVLLIIMASCQKQSEEVLAPETQIATKPAECIIDDAALRADILIAASGKGRPRPKTTTGDTTTTTGGTGGTTGGTGGTTGGTTGGSSVPTPTGTGYSCIYLDFDGQTVNSPYWNNGSTLNCAPAAMSSTQINEVLVKVNAIYSRYNVYVTTSESVYLNASPSMRIRVVVTPTSAWRPGVSGITYTGSFSWGDDTPCFVFSDRLYNTSSYIGEIASHEAGHSLGLNHQTEWDANCQLISSYRMGVVMGNSLYVSQGAWTYGPTVACNIFQNDDQVLTNKLGLRF